MSNSVIGNTYIHIVSAHLPEIIRTHGCGLSALATDEVCSLVTHKHSIYCVKPIEKCHQDWAKVAENTNLGEIDLAKPANEQDLVGYASRELHSVSSIVSFS